MIEREKRTVDIPSTTNDTPNPSTAPRRVSPTGWVALVISILNMIITIVEEVSQYFN